jgi:hypothetical protein
MHSPPRARGAEAVDVVHRPAAERLDHQQRLGREDARDEQPGGVLEPAALIARRLRIGDRAAALVEHRDRRRLLGRVGDQPRAPERGKEVQRGQLAVVGPRARLDGVAPGARGHHALALAVGDTQGLAEAVLGVDERPAQQFVAPRDRGIGREDHGVACPGRHGAITVRNRATLPCVTALTTGASSRCP